MASHTPASTEPISSTANSPSRADPHASRGAGLQYVEERRKIGKPLFYEPARARGGKDANPQAEGRGTTRRGGARVPEDHRSPAQPWLAAPLARDHARH